MFLRPMCALVYIRIHTRLHIVIYEKSSLFSYAPYYHLNHQLNNRVLLFKTYSCAPLKYIFDYLFSADDSVRSNWLALKIKPFFCLSIFFFYVFYYFCRYSLLLLYMYIYSRQFFVLHVVNAVHGWNTPSINKINLSNMPLAQIKIVL